MEIRKKKVIPNPAVKLGVRYDMFDMIFLVPIYHCKKLATSGCDDSFRQRFWEYAYRVIGVIFLAGW